MRLGFNTSGNNQTYYRTTNAVNLGKLRSTIGSTTRKFNYCNRNSPDLNYTFNCVFNTTPTPKPTPLDPDGGNIQTMVTEGGYVYLSQDYGQTWTKINQLANLGYSLYGIALSLNGIYQITSDTDSSVSENKIIISNNYGKSWTNKTSGLPPSFYFETGGICISGSGQYQYVINESIALTNEKKIYVSSDYGNSWAEPTLPPSDFGNQLSISSISCSTSGQKCVAIGISPYNSNNGILFQNTDYGQTWGNNQLYSDGNLVCVGISGDGSTVSIGYYNTSLGNVIIKTADFNSSSFVTGNVTNGPNRDWGIYTISLSYNGQYQIASNSASSGPGIGSRGYIYITKDYGVNWNYISNITGVPTVNMAWNNVSISPSGQTMVAVGYDGDLSGGTSWYVYSNDYGNTWKSQYFGNTDEITSIAIN